MSMFTMRLVALSVMLFCTGVVDARPPAAPPPAPPAAPPPPAPCANPPTIHDLDNCLLAWISDTNQTRPDGLADDVLDTIEDLDFHDALLAKATAAVKTAGGAAQPQLKGFPNEEKKRRDVVEAKLREKAFHENQCGEERVLCLNRDGALFDRRELKPQLFAGDRLTVIALSYGDKDTNRITLAARTIRATVTIFDSTVGVPAGPSESSKFKEVARLETTVGTDARKLEIHFVRAADASGKDTKDETITLNVELRQHIVEFGLMLPFAYNRDVTSQGAVEYGWEPDLAFTITLFLEPRISGEPLQTTGRRWLGVIAGADLTNPVREKRFYAGLDFSPVSGLAVDLGVTLMRWEYVPEPEEVPDVFTMDIQPDKRYRGSFFFGVRMTPEVFDSAKAAFDALKRKL